MSADCKTLFPYIMRQPAVLVFRSLQLNSSEFVICSHVDFIILRDILMLFHCGRTENEVSWTTSQATRWLAETRDRVRVSGRCSVFERCAQLLQWVVRERNISSWRRSARPCRRRRLWAVQKEVRTSCSHCSSMSETNGKEEIHYDGHLGVSILSPVAIIIL